MVKRFDLFGKTILFFVVLSIGCTMTMVAQQAPASTIAKTSWLWRAATGGLGLAASASKTLLGAAVSHPVIAVAGVVAAGYVLNQIPYTKPYMQKLYLYWSQFRCRNWHRVLQDTIGETAALTQKMAVASDVLSRINQYSTTTTNYLQQGVAKATRGAALLHQCSDYLAQGYHYVAEMQARAAAHISAIHNQSAHMSDALISALQDERFFPNINSELKNVIVEAEKSIQEADKTYKAFTSALQDITSSSETFNITPNTAAIDARQQESLALLEEALS